MKKDYRKAVHSLENLLLDDSHLSADDLRRELEEEGVDVQAFLKRFGTVVRKGYQYQMKQLVEKEQQDSKGSVHNLFGDLAKKSLHELQEIFDMIQKGVFGEELRSAATARCRNQVAGKVSEAELRSWLEDISAA